MNATEYQGLAQRTSADGHNRQLNGEMGLIGESGEVVDAIKKWTFQTTKGTEFPREKVIEEIGDVCWYAAEYCVGVNLDLAQCLDSVRYAGTETRVQELAMDLAYYAIMVYRVGVFDRERILGTMLRIAERILITSCRSTLEDAMELNIEKLKKRYPEGFDPERSMHRDT